MNLAQTHNMITPGTYESMPVPVMTQKRKVEVDILTDDHIRQMLGHVGAVFQADSSKRRRIDMLARQHQSN